MTSCTWSPNWLENATSFSPGDTPVRVTGHLLTSGGLLLDITDHGVGMGTEEMAHANWRLDNPPVVDVAVSRRMGLFVVARLAARHGIRVRLRPAPDGGLTALVWLPDELVIKEVVEALLALSDSRRPAAPARRRSAPGRRPWRKRWRRRLPPRAPRVSAAGRGAVAWCGRPRRGTWRGWSSRRAAC